jgi:hypothetical protein
MFTSGVLVSDVGSQLFVFEILIVASGMFEILLHGYVPALTAMLELQLLCCNYPHVFIFLSADIC